MEVYVKPALKELNGELTTIGNAYATVPCTETGEDYFFIKGYKTKLVEMRCTLNDLTWSFDVSNNKIIWHNKKTNQALATGVSTYESLTEPWLYARIQVKPTVAGVHGKLVVVVEASSL